MLSTPGRLRVRMLSLLGASALLTLAGCVAGHSPPAGASDMPSRAPPAPRELADVAFPSSPAGRAAAAWLHAVNDASREETLEFYRTQIGRASCRERV